VASDVNKPNGQHFIGPSEQQILNFVHPLPCRKVSGIGRVTEKILRGALGIETVHDLYQKRAEAFYLFKPATAQFLMRASIGYSDHGSSETPDGDDIDESVRKGISHERTFSPISSWTDLLTKVETITHALIEDLKERSLRPRTVTLKVKLANFDIITKSFSREVALFQPGNMQHSSQDMMDIVLRLLKEAKSSHSISHNEPFAVRLLGVRCSNFQVSKDNQISLDRYCSTMTSHDATKATNQQSKKQESQTDSSPVVFNPYKASPNRSIIAQREVKNSKSLTPLYEQKPNSKVTTKSVQCPICGILLSSGSDNNAINAHVDTCLNVSTVRQLAKEETTFADLKEEKSRKKRCLPDFFNTQL
jgi:DNA polymerase kappa